jgi:hypothetical protein
MQPYFAKSCRVRYERQNQPAQVLFIFGALLVSMLKLTKKQNGKKIGPVFQKSAFFEK